MALPLPPEYTGKVSILNAFLLDRLITADDHVQVMGRQTVIPLLCAVNHCTDHQEYYNYQDNVQSIERDRVMQERVLLWSKRLSMLFSWRNKKQQVKNDKTPPLGIVGESSKSLLRPSFSKPYVQSVVISSSLLRTSYYSTAPIPPSTVSSVQNLLVG